MTRTKGAQNRYPVAEARMTVRLPQSLLNRLDKVAQKHGQNRSEAVLEALRLDVPVFSQAL